MIQREIAVNTDYNFVVSYYNNGIQLIPTSANIFIFDNSGNTIINNVAMTVSSKGELSYKWLTASNNTENKNFKCKISYLLTGNTIPFVNHYLFDVVKTPLVCSVTDQDLFMYVGEIRDKVKEKTTSTSSQGTLSTCYAENLLSDSRDFKGGFVTFFIDDDPTCIKTHDARITAYDMTNGKITFTPSYSQYIDSDVTIKIRPSFQTIIDNAFNQYVIRDIRAKSTASYGSNTTASGYISGEVVNNMVIFKALENYCFSQVEENDDKWDIRTKRFAENYNNELGKLFEPFDQNGDGNIDSVENEFRPSYSSVSLVR